MATRRDRAPILSKFSNFGRSKRIKSVGTSVGSHVRGTVNPGGQEDIGIKVRGRSKGAANIGRTTKRTR